MLRAAEPSSAPSSTERALREAIRESGAEVVAIAVHDLATGRRILINERVSLHAASTMKVPVMMEVFRLVALGQLRLTDQLVVTNRFSSIVDGSDYFLTPESDSDRDIYRQLGRKMTVLSLVERMITISSNLATNILMERVGPGNVRKLTRELGAGEIEVRRGVEDSLAFQAGLNNTTTAFDLMLLLLALAEGRKSPPLDHRRMIRILAAQKFNDAIPAGLPAGTIVAHKTGEITRHNHDAAIVYPRARSRRSQSAPKPYVLVVLTRGISDQAESSRLIARLASIIHSDLAP
ncbi:MAG: serine hydrolase [Acidobacteria bacterium]|nr:serine hydrolase [Acidobacteriota bacterium]